MVMIRNILSSLSICFVLTLSAQGPARQRISFDNDWRFHFGHAGDPVKDFNYGIIAIFAKTGKTDNTALALNFNDSAWRKRMIGRWNYLL
jgi:beta-galactosidase